jgi:hypothetical protein
MLCNEIALEHDAERAVSAKLFYWDVMLAVKFASSTDPPSTPAGHAAAARAVQQV